MSPFIWVPLAYFGVGLVHAGVWYVIAHREKDLSALFLVFLGAVSIPAWPLVDTWVTYQMVRDRI